MNLQIYILLGKDFSHFYNQEYSADALHTLEIQERNNQYDFKCEELIVLQ
jgi:hypothetical protein